MILDVGCGNSPRGDVNCDLYVEDSYNHRNCFFNSLNVKAIPNFVHCDVLHLPFKSEVFSRVYCCQVIEHNNNPVGVLRELQRVCNGRLTVETVHWLGEAYKWRARKWFRQHHVSKFNRAWFVKAGKALGLNVVRTYVINYAGFPVDQVLELLKAPYEIGVEYAA